MRCADPAPVELLPELRPVAQRVSRRADDDRARARAVTTSASSHRRFAIAATEGVCPRCGAARAADQHYCLECGDALPVVSGRLAAMRRRWIGRIGWYPGDWMWLSLATLVVAAAGAAVAIAVSEHRESHHRG